MATPWALRVMTPFPLFFVFLALACRARATDHLLLFFSRAQEAERRGMSKHEKRANLLDELQVAMKEVVRDALSMSGGSGAAPTAAELKKYKGRVAYLVRSVKSCLKYGMRYMPLSSPDEEDSPSGPVNLSTTGGTGLWGFMESASEAVEGKHLTTVVGVVSEWGGGSDKALACLRYSLSKGTLSTTIRELSGASNEVIRYYESYSIMRHGESVDLFTGVLEQLSTLKLQISVDDDKVAPIRPSSPSTPAVKKKPRRKRRHKRVKTRVVALGGEDDGAMASPRPRRRTKSKQSRKKSGARSPARARAAAKATEPTAHRPKKVEKKAAVARVPAARVDPIPPETQGVASVPACAAEETRNEKKFVFEMAGLKGGRMTGRWYRLSKCEQQPDGTFNVTVAKSKEATKVRMAGKSAKGIKARFIRRVVVEPERPKVDLVALARGEQRQLPGTSETEPGNKAVGESSAEIQSPEDTPTNPLAQSPLEGQVHQPQTKEAKVCSARVPATASLL